MKYFVFKECKRCDGKGGYEIIIDDPGSTGGKYSTWQKCQDCLGAGQIKTDQFIELDSIIDGR
jgi:DnaJ-class molecular chaperone